MLLVNRMGLAATRAVVDAGLGEWSSNESITVLDLLASDGPSRPRDLIRVTRLTRGGLSNLFDRLESAGLITRSYGTVSGDRRGAMVAITAAGTAAVSAINHTIACSLNSQRSDLDELADVLSSLDNEPGRRPTGSNRAPAIQVRQLAIAGAAMSKALAVVDTDDPTPVATAVALGTAVPTGHTRPRELIKQTGLSSSGVSQLLDRLESAKLIHRRTGQPPDRRAVVVELTDEGHHHLEQQLTAIADHLALLRSAFDEPRP